MRKSRRRWRWKEGESEEVRRGLTLGCNGRGWRLRRALRGCLGHVNGEE